MNPQHSCTCRRTSASHLHPLVFGLVVWLLFQIATVPAAGGSILREVWEGVPGNSLVELTNSAGFPNSPTSTNYVTDLFEAPSNFAENYGQRLHGYVIPPKTGNYTFWIATDDNGALWLSTDETPAKARVIAGVNGWAASRQWEVEPNQRSEPVALVAGKAYYIAALNKEGGGGDNLAVRWLMPDGTDQGPIVATNLLAWGTSFTAPAISRHPADTKAVEGTTAVFSVGLSTIGLADYYWRKGGAVLPGVGGPELTYGPVRISDNGAMFDCIISNRLGAVTSKVARLAVTPDVTRPTLVALQNIGSTNLLVTFSEPVRVPGALDPVNYQISPGVRVVSAEFTTDQLNVLLVTTPLNYGATYTLAANNVQDQADAPNSILPGASRSFVAVEFAPAEIGGPIPAGGGAIAVAEGFDVNGGGAGIADRADQFHFAYQFRAGDFDVQTRVAGLDPTDAWAQAGLMARESLTNRSRFVAALATPGSAGCFWLTRTTTGGQASASGAFPVNYPDTWLRLKRAGNAFTAYASLDGRQWTQLGTATVALPQTLYFGLAVSGRLQDVATTARFRDLGPGQGTVSTAPFVTGEPLAPSSRRTRLAVSEIMFHPAARTDGRDLEFVELYNGGPVFEELGGWRISGAIDFVFPAATVLPAEGFLVVARKPADVAAAYGITGVLGGYTNALQNSAGTVRLHNRQGAVVLEANYSGEPPWPAAADGAGHSLVLARPSFGEGSVRAWAASARKGGSPGRAEPLAASPQSGVVINEFLAHTDPPQFDFIELFNRSTREVDLSGCWLSDDPDTNKFRIANRTSLAPGGVLVFDETQLGFRLDAAGETLFLVNSNGTQVVDAIRYRAQENGVSFGRSENGADVIRRLATPTPGDRNAPRRLEDVVISEIMYNPISGDDDDEYVEIHNRTDKPVDLGGWRFTDGINFEFPAGASIPGGGYAVVARNAVRLRANHPQLNAANAFGDFGGTLANAGERVALAKPDTIQQTNQIGEVETRLIHIDVAEVTYGDGGRWGRWSDGGGSSLELIDSDADPLLAASWADSDETQKAPWTEVSVTAKLEQGNTDTRFVPDRLFVLLQESGECLVDDIEVFKAGSTNLLANGAFEAGSVPKPTGWTFFGNHSATTGEADAGVTGTRCLHVRAQSEGDTAPNSIRTTLGAGLAAGNIGTIRAKVRWLAGWPEILFRTRGNWLELVGRMTVPANLGTPGLSNSRRVANAGPAIYDVAHFPPLPKAGEAVLVKCRVADPDGIGAVTLRYRVDPASTLTSLALRDDGAAGDELAGDGIWTARMPGRGAGTLVAFRIEATDTAGTPASAVFPANAPAGECLVRWGEPVPFGNLPHYHLWHTAAVGNARSASSGMDNTYRDCTLVYGNWRVIYNAGFRDKGSPWHGGFGDIAVTVPADELLLGTRDRAFASTGNGGSEETGIRSQLAAWLGQEMSIPFLGARYMRLYLNGGEFRNVLEDLEVPSREYADYWLGGGDAGDLYKLSFWFEFEDNNSGFGPTGATLEKFLGSDNAYKLARYRWCWQQRFGGVTANNLTNLFSLIEAVNTSNVSNFVQRSELLADTEEWMRVLAYQRILGNWDSWGYGGGQNMFAYKPGAERWQLLPWDIDFIFGLGGGPGEALWGGGDPVLNRMYDTPAFRRALWRSYQEAATGPMLASRYGPQIDARRRYLVANAISGVNDPKPIRDYVEGRRKTILSQIQANDAGTFELTVNGGNDFTASKPLATLTGRAPFAVASIEVNGVTYPVTWTDQNTFSVNIPLGQSKNSMSVVGLDRFGRPVPGAADRITVNYSGAIERPEDFLAINEIMYNPATPGTSFVELYNRSTLTTFDLSGWRLEGTGLSFAEGTVLGPRGYLVVVNDLPAFTAAYGVAKPIAGVFPGQLDNGGETLRLIKPGATAAEDQVIDQVRYDDDPPWPFEADGFGPSLQLLDAAQDNGRVGNWAAAATNATFLATPGAANNLRQTLVAFPSLWLNEVSPRNAQLADSAGDRDPWIELYNSGTDALDLGEFYLTDTYTNLTKWQFTTGTILPGKSFLLVWADNELTESKADEIHAAFRLNPIAGSVALVRMQNGVPAVMDYLDYGLLSDGQTFGSVPDGQPQTRRRLYYPTPAATNNSAVPPIQVVFNEWMAGNSRTLADPSDGDFDDWFELYNAGAQPADLSGYTLSDDLTNANKFTIPAGTVLAPGAFLLIWADEEVSQTNAFRDLHVNFKLSLTGEQLGLFAPNGETVDAIQFGAQANDVSEGRWPDGSAPPFLSFTTPTPRGANSAAGGNHPPVLAAIGDRQVREGELLAFTAKATDADVPAQALKFALVGAPAGAAIQADSGAFTWTPDEAQGPGIYRFTVKVSDNGTPPRSDFETIGVTVLEANRAPVLALLADRSISEGATLVVTNIATDPDFPANGLTFSLAPGAPAGVMLDAVTGVLSWAPAESDGPGQYDITVRVADDGSPVLSAERTFRVTVAEVDSAPQLDALPNRATDEGVTLSFPILAADPDGQAPGIEYALESGAALGATIDAASGQFRWTPAEAHGPGTYRFVVRATEKSAARLSTTAGFTVNVREVNRAPALLPVEAQTTVEGETLVLPLVAVDPDLPAQKLTFSLDPGAPASATLDAATGVLTFQAGLDDGASTNEILVRVSDDGAPPMSASQSVRVVVGLRWPVVINEIMYRPAVARAEFIELWNTSSNRAQSLAGVTLAGQNLQFALPAQTVLAPGQHAVVVRDQIAFAKAYTNAAVILGEFAGNLGFAADRLALSRSSGDGASEPLALFSAQYSAAAPWPVAASGQGASLQLVDWRLDARRPANWAGVAAQTPGAPRTLVTMTNHWRYYEAGDDLGTAWRAAQFNDSAWPGGAALLFVEGADLPAPKSTLLTLGRMTYYFRTHFGFAGSALGGSLKLSTIIDDGAVFYLNGRRLYGLFMPEEPLDISLPAERTVGDAALEGPFTVSADDLRQGDNVLAVEVHQASAGSSDIVMGAALEFEPGFLAPYTPGFANSVAGQLPPFPNVWINEVLPASAAGGVGDSWIELFNAGNQSATLDGCFLSNDLGNLNQWAFPTGVVVPARGFLRVWTDGAAPGAHAGEPQAGFRLHGDSGNVVLARLQRGEPAALDHVGYAGLMTGYSFGCAADGVPEAREQLALPTPLAANVPGTVPVVTRMDIGINGAVEFAWSARAGRTYLVQIQETLGNGPWQTIATVTASGATGTFMELKGDGRQARFYRLVLQP